MCLLVARIKAVEVVRSYFETTSRALNGGVVAPQDKTAPTARDGRRPIRPSARFPQSVPSPIILSELSVHQQFTELLVAEIRKVDAFYTSKVIELKVTIWNPCSFLMCPLAAFE